MVVVDFSVYYRLALREFPDVPEVKDLWSPAVAEILLVDYNGNAIEYVGRAPVAEEDALMLQN